MKAKAKLKTAATEFRGIHTTCPRCGRVDAHVQRATYKNGNKLWACVDCGRLFVEFSRATPR